MKERAKSLFFNHLLKKEGPSDNNPEHKERILYLSRAEQINEIKALIDMGDHSTITTENYPDLSPISIGVANYYSRTTEITMLNNVLGETLDEGIKAQLKLKILQLKKERDEEISKHLPQLPENYREEEIQTPLTLSDQDWNTLNHTVGAGLVDELNTDRMPAFEKLSPLSQKTLRIQATVNALTNATSWKHQLRETNMGFGNQDVGKTQDDTSNLIAMLQERGKKILQEG